MRDPNEVIKKLSKVEQLIFKNVLTIEKTHMVEKDLIKNSKKEKDIVNAVVGVIKRNVKNEN